MPLAVHSGPEALFCNLQWATPLFCKVGSLRGPSVAWGPSVSLRWQLTPFHTNMDQVWSKLNSPFLHPKGF